MDWAAMAAMAIQVLADIQQGVVLAEQIAPEVQTAIMLLTGKATLTDAQRQADLADLNAMQAELDQDAQAAQ